MDEGQLNTALEQAQGGDQAAFGLVYQQYSRRVLGLCRKMLGSSSAAEDATSEVFERAHRALHQYDRQRPFDRWLLTIASRHCLNRLHRQGIERRIFSPESIDAADTAAAASPLALCETREQRQTLLRAIDTLPDQYRLPLVLRFYSDLSYDEIAERLDITRNNVAVLLHRGKRQLRQQLRQPTREEA